MAVKFPVKPLIPATWAPVLWDNNPLCVCSSPSYDDDGCDDDDLHDGDNCEHNVLAEFLRAVTNQAVT